MQLAEWHYFFRLSARRKLLADKEKIYVDVGRKREKKGARRVLLTIYDERCTREEFTSNVRACVHMYNYFPT